MRVWMVTLILLFISIYSAEGAERINVVATYPYIESIVKEVVKDKVNVVSLSDGKWDPHFVPPKPSFAVKLRGADLLILNGAQLEIGWLPPLVDRASNGKILIGKDGYLDLSGLFSLIQRPDVISRAQGDVHPAGNPHFYLDPAKIPTIAGKITERLCKIDSKNCDFYNENLKNFQEKWKVKLEEWDKKMERFKGIFAFEYHRIFDYFFLRYEIEVEDTLEPLPGIPPTTSHLMKLIEKAKNKKISFIAYTVYSPKDSVDFLSKKAGIKAVLLPHDVGSTEGAKDIFSLFDEIISRIEKVMEE